MSKALAPSALREKYAAMMAEQGAAHPGQVYDPVFDWWIPECLEPELQRFLDEDAARTYASAQAAMREEGAE